MVYRVAVCDDIVRELEETAALTAALLEEAGVESCIRKYGSAAELLAARSRGEAWDLILLDIIMDGKDGIELAESLRTAGDDTDLVFTTSSTEHALAGYRSYPVSYLLKPLTRDSLEPVLTRCLKSRRRFPPLVLDVLEGGKTTVQPEEIRYVEIFGRELMVHFVEGKSVSCTGPLKATMDLLPSGCFYRCHRSFVVNLAHVSGIRKYCFLLHGGGEVPIAMRHYQEAQSQWLTYLK